MNSPLPAIHAQVTQAVRRRADDIEYFAERYHRAFEEEAATLAALFALHGDARVRRAFEGLRDALCAHTSLQEGRLFRSYEALEAVTASLHDAWIQDCTALSTSVTALRTAAAASAPSALRARVLHFAFEIERHLLDELDVLGRWSGAR